MYSSIQMLLLWCSFCIVCIPVKPHEYTEHYAMYQYLCTYLNILNSTLWVHCVQCSSRYSVNCQDVVYLVFQKQCRSAQFMKHCSNFTLCTLTRFRYKVPSLLSAVYYSMSEDLKLCCCPLFIYIFIRPSCSHTAQQPPIECIPEVRPHAPILHAM